MTTNVFFGVILGNLELVKAHPERITKEDKNMINDLNYEGIDFLFQKKIIAELKYKTIFTLISFLIKMD